MIDLLPSDVIGAHIAMTGSYESGLSSHIAALARTGGRMIDVGANIGYFSLIWLAGNPKNRVIAVEASPRNVRMLEANLQHNHMEDRVQVYETAAGQSAGTLEFSPGPLDQTGWGGLQTAASTDSHAVAVARVDSLVTDNEPIDVLKIDVEGADTWVVRGCEKLLQKKQVKHIFFEQNPHRLKILGIDEDDATSFVRSMGYQLEIIDNDPENIEWHAHV
jgi:FkbM family methyltransferase